VSIWMWMLVGAFRNKPWLYHSCWPSIPTRAPPGLGHHQSCLRIIPNMYLYNLPRFAQSMHASRQSSNVPVHKDGVPLPQACRVGDEPTTSQLEAGCLNPVCRYPASYLPWAAAA
jgi:hypothetical protein